MVFQYLAKEQWGKSKKGRENQEENFRKTKITEEGVFDTGDFTIEEMEIIIKKLKRRKSQGPDEIPLEIFKEMKFTIFLAICVIS